GARRGPRGEAARWPGAVPQHEDPAPVVDAPGAQLPEYVLTEEQRRPRVADRRPHLAELMVAYAQTREDEAPALDDASVGEPVGRAGEELRWRSAHGEERHEDVGRHLHAGRAAVDNERADQPVVEGDLHVVDAAVAIERDLPARRVGPSRGRRRGDDCEQHSGGEWGHASTHTIASRLRL